MRTINDKILAIHTDNVPDGNYRSVLIYLFYRHIGNLYGKDAWVPCINIMLRFTATEHIVIGELNLPFHGFVLIGVWEAILS